MSVHVANLVMMAVNVSSYSVLYIDHKYTYLRKNAGPLKVKVVKDIEARGDGVFISLYFSQLSSLTILRCCSRVLTCSSVPSQALFQRFGLSLFFIILLANGVGH